MTVAATTNKVSYAGNGLTTGFAFSFPIFAESDMVAILINDSTGVEVTLSLTTHYSISASPWSSGGTLTMVTAPASGETLLIKRVLPLTQGTDYVENDEFPADSHENALDKLTMICQQLEEEDSRTLTISAGSSADPDFPAFVNDAFLTNDGSSLVWGTANAAAGSLANIVEDVTPQSGGPHDMNDFQDQWSKGADVASGSALTLLTDGNYFDITGNTTINSIDTTGGPGTLVKLHFDGAVPLTDSANVSLPGGANFTTAADDEFEFLEYETGKYRCTGYALASGKSVGAIAIADLPTGSIAQVVNVIDGAVATGTAQTPDDNTIPQITEGDEYMTLAITPSNSSSNLLIQVVANVTRDTANDDVVLHLHQDSTAGALAAVQKRITGALASEPVLFNHFMTAGTTSLTTFKLRIGGDGAGTTTFNGYGGARKLGGVMASSITITEILP
ncbi:MAG: hypothetical protein IME93_03200 [Proteobacteria bacterium]|nr:hypothetical protein [Pseudomonadota bacterium]